MGWTTLSYRRFPVTEPAVGRFVKIAESLLVNGGAVVACLVPKDAAAFDVAVSTDLQGWAHPFVSFLQSPDLPSQIPELKLGRPPAEKPALTCLSTLAVEGELAYSLLNGGAYTKGLALPEARTVTRELMENIVGGRWNQISAARVDEPWCDWFYDVAWDSTFLMLDRLERRMWLLCMTDTD